ncbi:hypothetical protein [Salinispora fenicalii]|uniref:hypothetical protein n=1 Tax=Salinispora fenicalii TaxID=1137263 RepID=UPI00047F275E|nr:hypothetical protein [Salinispora fenicalii]
MSNYQAQNNAVNPQAASKRRRKLWIAAGLTGAVSIAAVGLTGVGAGARDLAQNAAQIASSGGQGADAGGEGHEGREGGWEEGREGGWEDHREGGWEDRRGGDWDGNRDAGDRGKKKRGKEVPCKTDKLIQAIVYANNNQGGVLELAKDCTYTLTRSDDEGNGLPIIEERITLLGDNTKIVRDGQADNFRILNVGRSGHLKVKDLVIKGGQVGPLATDVPVDGAADPGGMPPFSNSADAPQDGDPGAMPVCGDCGKGAKPDHHERHSNDGGGVLVQDGGTAEFEKTHFVDNQAGGVGGGIANFGKTELYHTTADGNTSLLQGGGIFNAGVLRTSKSTVKTNNAILAGGGIANGAKFADEERRDIKGGTVWIEKTEIFNNATFGPGGGLSDFGGNTMIDQSRVIRNVANGSGGGISAAGRSSLDVKETEVIDNITFMYGGGLSLRDGTVANVVKSEIKKNRAVDGAGAYNHRSEVTFRDSTISDNFAGNSTGGVYNVRGEVDLSKTKVSRNLSKIAPGGMFNERGEVTVDNKSAIKGNTPTNCEGSPDPIENCFG